MLYLSYIFSLVFQWVDFNVYSRNCNYFLTEVDCIGFSWLFILFITTERNAYNSFFFYL